ncbi:DNA mismatch repair ATPase MutS [Neobacillus niacini]|uniref:VWA-like domain-containing protein n=1 Tax=Neobacillus niacini TaxID=86668 RepID=UPI0010511DAF|nr:VWA-like domain-containing protein [Neobacillus niacini]MDR7077529.1 DNA mismatch repair ATPase MutS [Neobacillus niacini]
MKWHKNLLKIIQDRQEKRLAVMVDTSTNETKVELIANVVKFFKELTPETILIQADFKIRTVNPITEETEIKYHTHGKASYTLALEWAEEEKIETVFYITDLTGFLPEEMQVPYEVYWLVPTEFVPKAPFGKVMKIV